MISLDFLSTATCPKVRLACVAQALTRCNGPSLALAGATQASCRRWRCDPGPRGPPRPAARPRSSVRKPGIERGKHTLEGVMGGNAARQLQKPSKPRLTLLGEQGDVRPVITVGDHPTNSHNDNVDEQMPCSSNHPRINENRKCFLIEPTRVVATMRSSGKRAKVRRIVGLFTCPNQGARNNWGGV